MSPQTAMNPWALQGALFELLEAREEALARAETARTWCSREAIDDIDSDPNVQQACGELGAIEHGITQFVAQQLRDVDGLRIPLLALEQGVALNKADAAVATNRAMILQNRYDRLKDLIKQCMVALDQAGEWKPKQTRKFESPRGSFTLRGNGGAAPVEITDESLVPDEYCRVTVRMPAQMLKPIFELAKEVAAISGNPDSMWRDIESIKCGPREISKSAIAAALSIDCERCGGNGVVEEWGDPEGIGEGGPGENPCKGCGGSGKAGVPGARLASRSESLVVK